MTDNAKSAITEFRLMLADFDFASAVMSVTTSFPELRQEAIDWCLDCFPNDYDEINDADIIVVFKNLRKHYDGGIESFIVNTLV